MVEIHPQKIEGRWTSGVALDFHTTSSTLVGYTEGGYKKYDTVRPPIAELLYQLKYKFNQNVAPDIIATVAGYLRPHMAKFELIVPVPPSTVRAIQPVLVLARGIGAALGVPVVECVTTTRATTELKGVTDPEKRKELVADLYTVDSRYTAGRTVLLFDDLFRSGTTMNAITDVLLRQGGATVVRALTITRTRSNQ